MVEAPNSGGVGFPGRRVGGAAMVLGPLLLLARLLLRVPANFLIPEQRPFAFPEQLAAFERYPTLMAASCSSC